MSKAAINWTGVFFYGLIAFAVCMLIIYFVKWPPPIYALINNLVTKLSSITLPTVAGIDLGKFIGDNKGMILGVGVTAVPLIYTSIKSYLDKETIKKQLAAAEEKASLEAKAATSTLTSTKSSLEAQLAEQQKKITELENEGNLAESQKLVTQLTERNRTLELRLQELSALKTPTLEQMRSTMTQVIAESNRVP